MPNSSQKNHRLRTRRRSFGLALALASSLGLAFACVDPDSPAGYREWRSTAGAAGETSTAGAPGDGSAGLGGGEQGGEAAVGGETASSMGGDGGSSGNGGAAGKAGNGGGGTGGSGGPTCGDTRQEGQEECDDGNVTNFDGCSSNCKTTCEACLDEFYGEDPEYAEFLDLCHHSMVKAVEGPSAGTLRSTLCQKAVACMIDSGCAVAAAKKRGRLVDTCYCGDVSTQECESGGPSNLGNPQGPCVAQLAAAAETRSPTEIQYARFENPTLGIGMASALVRLGATAGYCLEACTYERPLDDCTRCAAGDVHTFTVTATCPLCFDIANCDYDLLRCVQENCEANDTAACLDEGGPCAAELAAAGANAEPTKLDLACRAQSCATECFKR